MLKLPQILGWRPMARGRHERPTAELPEETFRPEEIDAAIEALALPEDLEEVLTDSPSQGSEETREQAETTAEEEAPPPAAPSAAGGEEPPGQADFLAGRQFWANRQPEQALEALLRAGEQGHREAQYLCGRIYQQWVQDEGRERLALTWYRRAAKQGHLDAQLSCASMYEQGRGAQMNLKRALSWYEQAARQGSVEAQLKCGCMYSQGRAETRNPKKARHWLETAAAGGSEEAQRNLRERF